MVLYLLTNPRWLVTDTATTLCPYVSKGDFAVMLFVHKAFIVHSVLISENSLMLCQQIKAVQPSNGFEIVGCMIHNKAPLRAFFLKS